MHDMETNAIVAQTWPEGIPPRDYPTMLRMVHALTGYQGPMPIVLPNTQSNVLQMPTRTEEEPSQPPLDERIAEHLRANPEMAATNIAKELKVSPAKVAKALKSMNGLSRKLGRSGNREVVLWSVAA